MSAWQPRNHAARGIAEFMGRTRLHRMAVLNRATQLSDTDAASYVAALQRDIDSHFAPDWGIGAVLTFVPKTDERNWEGQWNILLLDNSDVAQALGYHELTPEGMPVSHVYVETCRKYGASETVCLSHEAKEMLGDPDIQLLAPSPRGRLYAYENCDAVEADSLGRTVGGHLQSAHVLPRWFSPDAQGGRFDSAGACSLPFQIVGGGYMLYTDHWPADWQQEFRHGEGKLNNEPTASRERQRIKPRLDWRYSVA